MLMVGNVLTHYRLPLYEALQERVDLDLVLYSDGGEWYWQHAEEPGTGKLHSVEHLKGVWLGRTRVTPALALRVAASKADVVVKDPNGKFALSVTYFAARLTGKPFVFWASLWEHPSGGVHRFTRPVMRLLYRKADAIVTYGHHVSRYVIEEGADPERVIVSPQAVAPRATAVLKKERWGGTRQLLYVGRLEPWKGVSLLMQALSGVRRRDWHLKVAGEGSSEPDLRKLVADLGLGDRVTFLGRVPNVDVHALYAAAQFVVVPSVRTNEFSEPWALVINEAMQAGAVVVASDAVGAVQDGLVEEGRTGFVFVAGDADALGHALNRAMAQPADGSRRMAAESLNSIGAFTHAAAADAFVTAANVAIDRHSGRAARRRKAERE